MKSRYDDLCRNIPDANILYDLCPLRISNLRNLLDNILMTNNIESIDLLSADIDSDDPLSLGGGSALPSENRYH